MLLISLSFLLLACNDDTGTASTTTAPPLCDASKWQKFIGQKQADLDPLPVRNPLRLITKNQPVTLEYQADRLTIETNENGVIERIYCG